MNHGENRNAAELCPLAPDVRAASSGHGDQQLWERVERHLAECPACSELVDSLEVNAEEASDAMLQALSALPATVEDEPEFQQLQSTLLTMSPSGRPGGGRRLADPPIGDLPQTLGNYELTACVGRGAWGAIYRARHLKLDQIVAVKVLDATRLHQAPAMDHFIQEMKAVGQLNHPNIVRATDAGEDRSFHYLVMELLHGVDAARLLQIEQRLCSADACEIVRQAAVALDYAHRNAWVHRDVKPSNLMVTTDGQVKLLDLGIAGRWDGDPPSTPDQTPLGTAEYMAPEQWTRFASVDARADVYSLGCTLRKLLTGRSASCSASTDAGQQASDAKPADAEARSDVRRGLERIIDKMAAPQPDDRYESAAQVAAALQPWSRRADLHSLVRRCYRGQAPAQAPSPAGSRTSRTPASIRPTRRALVTGAALAAGGAALWAWRIGRPSPSLRRAQWRPLHPDGPAVLLSGDVAEALEVNLSDASRLWVRSTSEAVVRLGRAVAGPLALRATIAPETDGVRAGMFFRWRHVSQAPQQVEFQSVELWQDLVRRVRNERRVQWRQWVAVREAQQVRIEEKTLAEASIELPSDAEECDLTITLGRTGVPQVRVAGQAIPSNAWTLSTAGRRLASLEPSRLPYEFLGGIGLINSGGAAAFRTPELAYL